MEDTPPHRATVESQCARTRRSFLGCKGLWQQMVWFYLFYFNKYLCEAFLSELPSLQHLNFPPSAMEGSVKIMCSENGGIPGAQAYLFGEWLQGEQLIKQNFISMYLVPKLISFLWNPWHLRCVFVTFCLELYTNGWGGTWLTPGRLFVDSIVCGKFKRNGLLRKKNFFFFKYEEDAW